MFGCDIAHHRSVAVLCMLYKVKCSSIHPLYGSLPVPYVPVRVERGTRSHIGILMPILAAEPRSAAGPLFAYHCPCGTILLTLYSMVWYWRVSREMLFYWTKLLYPILYSTIFPFLCMLSICWYCGAMVFGLIGCSVCRSLSFIVALPIFFIIIIIY